MNNLRLNLKTLFLITSGLSGALLTGCAGPSTPLGAVWATHVSQISIGPLRFLAGLAGSTPEETVHAGIRIQPARQVLHGRTTVQLTLTDTQETNVSGLAVRHNGLDVTRSFLKQAQISHHNDGREAVIRVENIRLSPRQEHLIEFLYTSSSGAQIYTRYLPPTCTVFDPENIHHTGAFNPTERLVRLIERISRDHGINPAFTAALIAQESAFNPRTVSWAKAIGLTQVTSVAEEEVSRRWAGWPRYPGLKEMPTPWVKFLVMSGNVNDRNEWRLDEELSIHGGLTYAKLMGTQWNTEDNRRRIDEIRAKSRDTAAETTTRLLLASYHSGYTRVSTAVNRLKGEWLTAPELGEARNYVNRVISLCDHFSGTSEGERK